MTTHETRPRVVAVVVSYNRRDLLVASLAGVLGQRAEPAGVVVVDNASTDGSADAARRAAPGAQVIELQRNIGGAGGFAVGIAAAIADHDADWVWLMDDDTVPTPGALGALLEGAVGSGALVAGSRVVWTDGSDHPMNTPRRHPLRRGTAQAVPVRSSSFVSMLVSADAVRRHGLPIADYFIWNDDFEYSTRLIRGATGVYVPGSVVEHRTKRLVSTDDDPGERFYYEVRNKLWMYRLSSSLSLPEKAVYGLATVRRWVRTFRRSTDRGTLRAALRRGLADGVRTRPRSNAEVAAGLFEAQRVLREVER